MSRTIVILGSTGSIGENAVRVAKHLGDRIRVAGLAAGHRWERLAQQARELDARQVVVADTGHVGPLRQLVPEGCRAAAGNEALCDLVTRPEVDTVLCAIVGTAGFEPVLAAIRAGKEIALASKEVLVMAGPVVMAEAGRCGVRILPVDSEHSAIFQCLEAERLKHEQGLSPNAEVVRRLVLTASGGPFRHTPGEELARVTPEHALAHPTWNMGRKVTIDSATLMNKGLELIEARWLFDLPPEKIDVWIHPQSIIHSMVEFVDGAVLAQLSVPDMRLPIQYALTWPERCEGLTPPLDLERLRTLTFEEPDHARFPALRLARRALDAGGTMPAVLNAANEVAVDRFCEGDLPFPGIPRLVEAVMTRHTPVASADLVRIREADAWAREEARRLTV